jgi:Tol biopolymer transport system component
MTAAYSPDGTRIAFVSEDGPLPQGVYVTTVGGGDPVLIAPKDGSINQVAWSPEGDEVAFWTILNDAQLTGRLSIARADGNGVRVVDTGGMSAGWFSWSPDGRSFVVTVTTVRGDQERSDLYLVDSAGGTPRRLTDIGDARDPDWSPDGSTIVFVANDGRFGGPSRLWLVRPDGSGATPLSPATTGASGPLWSPDGSAIAFRHDCDIWVVVPGGTRPGPLIAPELRPDSCWAPTDWGAA